MFQHLQSAGTLRWPSMGNSTVHWTISTKVQALIHHQIKNLLQKEALNLVGGAGLEPARP